MALFDSFLEKLRLTATTVTEIGEAVNDKGAGINLDTDPLVNWPDMIRKNIKTAPTIAYDITLAVNNINIQLATMQFPVQGGELTVQQEG